MQVGRTDGFDLGKKMYHRLEGSIRYPLTEKQFMFAYYMAIHGDYAQAYEQAGYKVKSRGNNARRARDLYRRSNISDKVALIKEKIWEAMVEKAIFDRDEIFKRFNEIYMNAMAAEDYANANKSLEHVAKILGLFEQKREGANLPGGMGDSRPSQDEIKKQIDNLNKIVKIKTA